VELVLNVGVVEQLQVNHIVAHQVLEHSLNLQVIVLDKILVTKARILIDQIGKGLKVECPI
jgi:hypothetical protein